MKNSKNFFKTFFGCNLPCSVGKAADAALQAEEILQECQ